MGKKPEVNLEVGSGFFRISAEEVIYNITFPGGPAREAVSVPEQFGQVQRQAVAASENGAACDEYYRKVSNDLYREIGQLAKSLSSTIMHIPLEDRRLKRVELDEAGEKIEDAKNQLKDIVEMTESATMEIMDRVEHIQGQTVDVQDLLALLKDHKAFQIPEDTGGPLSGDDGSGEAAEVIGGQLARAREIVERLRLQHAAMPLAFSGEGEPEGPARYLFSLDTIFQTLYEFCTNETVKGHLSKVREETGAFFDLPTVLEEFNRLVAPIEPDADNFFQVPLSELLGVLEQTCTDGKIKNLFKRMESSRDAIFLDQNLPLEVPPLELEEAPDGVGPAETATGREEFESDLEELRRLLDASKAGLAALPVSGAAAPGMSTMSMADQTEIFDKIEAAFGMVNNISGDVQKITEALSFQDLSGQQIMKIIKLLSDFQVQLLALVVSFGSQLKLKERNASITPEESKRLAQEEVDSYINRINRIEEDGESAVLDQNAVNQILEDMGF